jgi:peroxiredoxin
MRPLASLLGPKGATIVFFRSADWCPPCKAHLIELQGHLAELRRLGMNVIAISRDSQAILAEFASRHRITFPLLSDADSTVIKRYGVLDASVAPTRTEQSGGPPYYGVPYRGTITINRDRRVTSTNFQKTWQEHTTMASVLLRLGDSIDVPATAITAPNLEMKSYTTDAAVAPGAHFLLVLDLRPDQKIHVYAPGNPSYIPIALTIQKQPGVVVSPAPPMPKAEDFFFKPLNEHVAVYRRPFRITREVMIDPSRQGQAALNGAKNVTINGTVTYQACDDTTCYTPKDVPLSWAVDIRPLDDTRIVIPKTN